MNVTNFSKNGFIVVKQAISKLILKELQKNAFYILNKYSRIDYNSFVKITKKINDNNKFNVAKKIHEYFLYKKNIEKILQEKKLLNCLVSILGSDLCYENNASTIILNTPIKNNLKKNYMFKEWHQEIWSGADTNTLQIWIPLLQKDNTGGQLEIIKGSHRWGHIPHHNREPIDLPKSYKTLKTNLKLGDALIFSTVLVHRTVPTEFPRLSLPFHVRNFKYKNISYENNKSWTIFSHSELTKIEKFLGNHYLSPFRLKKI